jgi:phosphoserine phosphatase RsbU/P
MTPLPCPRLRITDPAGRRIVAIDKPMVTLGRRSESDVCISGAGVSRAHAEIVNEGGICTLRDHGSRFGTFVNDVRRETHVLTHGDRLRFGQSNDTEIVFLLDDEATSADRSASSAAAEFRVVASLLQGLRALGSGRVLDEVLALVLDSAIEVSEAERGFIMLANRKGELEFKLARGRGAVTLPGRTFATSHRIPEAVFATGQASIVEDLRDGELAGVHEGTIALGIRHVLCVPLRLVRYVDGADRVRDDTIIGVLYLDSHERGVLRCESARLALETMSAQAAVAIDSARLYREALEKAKFEEELKVAAGIQRALLPASQRQGPFFSAAAASIACRTIGGDFFDYVDLSGGQFGYILGDVAGKGPPAALLAAAALGMFGVEAAYQPAAASVLARLNRGVFRHRIEGRFLTAFYGILADDGTFTYSNAGHNAAVLMTAEGPRRLDKGGMPIGMFDESTYEQETLSLRPGDTVVTFSDGVTEALNAAGEEFGDPTLVDCVQAHVGKAPPDLLETLLGRVHRFCGQATQSDDVTLVILRYEGR